MTHVFAICTPYAAPQKQYASIENLVDSVLPQFAYQIHLRSPEVENFIKSPEQIRQFLDGMYGAQGPNGELAFDPYKGVLLENLSKLRRGWLLDDKVSVTGVCPSMPCWDHNATLQRRGVSVRLGCPILGLSGDHRLTIFNLIGA